MQTIVLKHVQVFVVNYFFQIFFDKGVGGWGQLYPNFFWIFGFFKYLQGPLVGKYYEPPGEMDWIHGQNVRYMITRQLKQRHTKETENDEDHIAIRGRSQLSTFSQ